MSNDGDTSPTIIVLTAPSGSGKTTIAHGILTLYPNIRFSVSATTRKRRENEEDGVHYHFVSDSEFEDLIAADQLLEYEVFYGNKYYGTLWSEVENSTADNPVLLDIEVLGASRVKEKFGDKALVIFIRPPDIETLRNRLIHRRTEDDEMLALRLSRAKMELSMAENFDHVVINDEIETAIDETALLIKSFLERRHGYNSDDSDAIN